MSHVLLPFMVLPIYSALRGIPHDYARAAQILGASEWATFREVILPLSMPGVTSGCLMVFLLALGFFVTPALIGGPQQMMIATLVSQQVREMLDWSFAGALVGVHARVRAADRGDLQARRAARPLRGGVMSALARKGRPRRRAGDAALGAAAYAVTIFLLLPTLVIVPMSVGPSATCSSRRAASRCAGMARISPTRTGSMPRCSASRRDSSSTVCATVDRHDAGAGLVRGRLPGKELIELLVIGPVIVPHIALAVAMFLVFEQLRLTGTLLGFAMAHTVLALPFVVFTVLAALYRFDVDLERAALSCGAGPVRTFRHVTLPLIAPGVISAALFAFIISFDEAVVSFFISNLDRKTLPRKMFEDIDYNISPTIAAVATMLTLLTIAALLGSHVVRNRMDRRAASAESKPTATAITPKAT